MRHVLGMELKLVQMLMVHGSLVGQHHVAAGKAVVVGEQLQKLDDGQLVMMKQ